MTPKWIQRAKILRQEGLSFRKIAKRLEISSHSIIIYWLNEEYKEHYNQKKRDYYWEHAEKMKQNSRNNYYKYARKNLKK